MKCNRGKQILSTCETKSFKLLNLNRTRIGENRLIFCAVSYDKN